MAAQKKYFHDHLVLALLSVNGFIAVGGIIFLLVRLATSHGNGYIVQYRSVEVIDRFKTGTVVDLLSFAVFMALVLGIHSVLSWRMYKINRHLAIAVLALGILLLVLTSIISNALLVLR
ncbi:MAG: hypothetical protein QFB86_03385 [Patescibacteria group bacterium]|nr:hypothetical protein [Patescibacteria group bacterium]